MIEIAQIQTADIPHGLFGQSIGTEDVFLHYQPIMNLQDGSVAGFEALMRWKHPEMGFIPPSSFIPMAEESGEIIAASRWALREACRFLKKLERRVGIESGLFMSVNFSPSDFAEENFLDQLYTILSETDIAPDKLCLELAERLLAQKPEGARETLALCHKAGLKIAIDDFGTGFPSAEYLDRYVVSHIKIDRSFVSLLTRDQGARDYILSVLDFAKARRIGVIAEGVEQAEEKDILKKAGCDFAQGYFFARPQSARDLETLLAEWAVQRKIF